MIRCQAAGVADADVALVDLDQPGLLQLARDRVRERPLGLQAVPRVREPEAVRDAVDVRIRRRGRDYTFIDTGAMYRTLAWYCLKNRIPLFFWGIPS